MLLADYFFIGWCWAGLIVFICIMLALAKDVIANREARRRREKMETMIQEAFKRR